MILLITEKEQAIKAGDNNRKSKCRDKLIQMLSDNNNK